MLAAGEDRDRAVIDDPDGADAAGACERVLRDLPRVMDELSFLRP